MAEGRVRAKPVDSRNRMSRSLNEPLQVADPDPEFLSGAQTQQVSRKQRDQSGSQVEVILIQEARAVVL